MEDVFYREPDNRQLLKDLESLELSSTELAHRLSIWGDFRKESAILRSIQRMKSQETPISGEMRVIINMLLDRQRNTNELYSNVKWYINDMYKSNNGQTWSATIDDYQVDLHPQTRGRWLVNVTHKNGYCAPWPVWPQTLDEAKRKALVVIEDTRAHFATYDL